MSQLGKVDTTLATSPFYRDRVAYVSRLVACAQGIYGPRGAKFGASRWVGVRR